MIVFPMAGQSSRFSKAGYQVPKYMLEAGKKSLFRHAVEGFSSYFEDTEFLFIYRDVSNTHEFIQSECDAMKLRNARLVSLTEATGGQAETVHLGLKKSEVTALLPITIFNIDTIRPNFQYPTDIRIKGADGYLEVFQGEGKNWSFVRAENVNSTRVIETTEKNPISDLCCTGLYHFAHAGAYTEAFVAETQSGPTQAGEFYVAPLYNRLITQGADIRYELIDRSQVIFSGVPSEYETFKANLDR